MPVDIDVTPHLAAVDDVLTSSGAVGDAPLIAVPVRRPQVRAASRDAADAPAADDPGEDPSWADITGTGTAALAGALGLTTAHVASREQFGRPLATFQAVAQQVAEIYIASRTLHLATLSACWRLSEGRDPGADLAVAGYWCAQQASQAVRRCHHLHGGLGMDVTYPLHRFSALVTDLIRYLGGAEYRLERNVH